MPKSTVSSTVARHPSSGFPVASARAGGSGTTLSTLLKNELWSQHSGHLSGFTIGRNSAIGRRLTASVTMSSACTPSTSVVVAVHRGHVFRIVDWIPGSSVLATPLGSASWPRSLTDRPSGSSEGSFCCRSSSTSVSAAAPCDRPALDSAAPASTSDAAHLRIDVSGSSGAPFCSSACTRRARSSRRAGVEFALRWSGCRRLPRAWAACRIRAPRPRPGALRSRGAVRARRRTT